MFVFKICHKYEINQSSKIRHSKNTSYAFGMSIKSLKNSDTTEDNRKYELIHMCDPSGPASISSLPEVAEVILAASRAASLWPLTLMWPWMQMK
jgi:hypothetical protein